MSMEAPLGFLAAVLGLLSLTIIGANYHVLWKQLRAKPGERTPSLIPIVGGLLGFMAWRLSGAAWALWAPLLDPGCYLVYFLIMTAARRIRGH